MKKAARKFATWMDGLKRSRKTLVCLICADIFMAIASNIVDWPWLMSVKWYLIPFTTICSLYPLTLAIWFSMYYFKKKIPAWYTNFIFIGIVSYGIMAYVYFPVYMTIDGVQLKHLGNMLWVTIYALQSLIIVSEIKRPPAYQFAMVIGYFAFKDYCDRFLGTFIDILRPDFPEGLKWTIWSIIIALHISAISLAFYIPVVRRKRDLMQREGLQGDTMQSGFQSVTD